MPSRLMVCELLLIFSTVGGITLLVSIKQQDENETDTFCAFQDECTINIHKPVISENLRKNIGKVQISTE